MPSGGKGVSYLFTSRKKNSEELSKMFYRSLTSKAFLMRSMACPNGLVVIKSVPLPKSMQMSQIKETTDISNN